MWTLTNVPADRQKFLGFPGGLLKDSDDLGAKVAKLKPGSKVTMMGTAEGGELKAPQEKVIFEEDLTPEERAQILKEAKVEVIPVGLKNLGNTCYMNATLQCLCRIKELRQEVVKFTQPGAEERDIDSVLTSQFRAVSQQLEHTGGEAVVPLQFVMALRQRFPRFAEMQHGGYMQQDADECLKGLMTVLSGTLKAPGGNRIDELFGFNVRSTLKCLECDEEPPSESVEAQRTLICHLGTQTDPISHLHQGVQLSLKEHIEKNSTVLGRTAQYEKTSCLDSLPPYLIVQYARFGYKGANEWAGTASAKVKLIRKCAFTKVFDLFDCASEELKTKLAKGRVKRQELDDAQLEKSRAALAEGKPQEPGKDDEEDVDMEPAEDAEMKQQLEEYETGAYELIAIVSHKGRTADGGHYVGWALNSKGDGKKVKDDRWVQYDDEDVSIHNFKDLVGTGIDLQGGKADTQIAYLSFYKKVTVRDKGNLLGKKEEEKNTDATASGAAPAATE